MPETMLFRCNKADDPRCPNGCFHAIPHDISCSCSVACFTIDPVRGKRVGCVKVKEDDKP
jgi:hypothetical protein